MRHSISLKVCIYGCRYITLSAKMQASVVTELCNFTSATLSSLYHDMNKDRLYCHSVDSLERQIVLTTMQQVLEHLLTIMAPILPHTAEEIHQTWYEKGSTVPSVFTQTWRTMVGRFTSINVTAPIVRIQQPLEWHNEAVESDMSALLQVRSAVTKALEQVRRKKWVQFE
jgi:isoleucyl-tRNA synthetase